MFVCTVHIKKRKNQINKYHFVIRLTLFSYMFKPLIFATKHQKIKIYVLSHEIFVSFTNDV